MHGTFPAAIVIKVVEGGHTVAQSDSKVPFLYLTAGGLAMAVKVQEGSENVPALTVLGGLMAVHKSPLRKSGTAGSKGLLAILAFACTGLRDGVSSESSMAVTFIRGEGQVLPETV